MKKTKILVFVLLVALCLSCFAACNKTPKELVDARDYLYNQYKEFDGKATPADFNRVGAVMINGTKYPIEWTVEVKTEGQSESVKVVKNEDGTVTVDVDEKAAVEISYDLVATISNAKGKTITVTFHHTVPQWRELTWAEYMATEKGQAVVIKGKVASISSKSTGDKYNCMYIYDNDGGYYVYSLTEDPLTTYPNLALGMTVQVTGEKDIYNGTHEVKNATFTVIDAESTIEFADITDIFAATDDMKSETLTKKAYMPVTIKNVIIGDIDEANSYYYFTIGASKSYLRISSSDNMLSEAETKAFKDGFAALKGKYATVKGLATVYSGSFYIQVITADAAVEQAAPEKDPAGQIADVKGRLAIDTKINGSGRTFTLPTQDTVYTSVNIAWAASSEVAKIEDGKVTYTFTEDGTVKLTATLTHATDATVSDTKEFEVTLSVGTPVTVAEFLEKAESEDEIYILTGFIVADAEDSKAGSFVFADATGAVFSYNKFDVAVGDKVKIVATRAANAGLPQLGTISVTKLDKAEGESYTYPEATELAAADIDLSALNNAKMDEMDGTFYKITGTILYKSDKYFNAGTVGATAGEYNQLLSVYTASSLVDENLLGKEVVIYGYVRGFSANKYLTVQVVRITEKDKTDAEKLAEAKEALTSVTADGGSEFADSFTLVTEGANGTKISWAIKEEGITALTINGANATVVKPEADVNVTLIATISLEGSSEAPVTKEFPITITATIPTYTVTVTEVEGATIVVKNGETVVESGATLNKGTELTITVTPDETHILNKVMNGEATLTAEEDGTYKLVLTANANITVDVTACTVVTVAEFLEKAEGNDLYMLTGFIVADAEDEGEGSFVFADGTGAVFSYNKFDVAVGDKVKIVAKRAANAGLPQLGTQSVTKLEKAEGESYAYPEATELAAADIDLSALNNAKMDEMDGTFYKITGTILYKSGSYTSAGTAGATAGTYNQVLSLYTADSLVDQNLLDKEVIVYGYVRGFKTGKYLTIQVVKIEAKPEATDAEKLAEAKEALTSVTAEGGDKFADSFTLVTEGANGTKISWAIKEEGITALTISGANATVVKPEVDVNVTLIATISIEGSSEAPVTKEFPITITATIPTYTVTITAVEGATIVVKTGETVVESGATFNKGTEFVITVTVDSLHTLSAVKNGDTVLAREADGSYKFTLAADANITVEVANILTITEFKALAESATGTVVGIVTNIDSKATWLQNAEGDALYVYGTGLAGVAIGKQVVLSGTRAEYKGLAQLKDPVVVSVEDTETVISATTIDEAAYKALVANDASKLVNVSGLVYVSGTATADKGGSLTFKLGETNVTVRVEKGDADALNTAALSKLAAGDEINIKNANVGWFNSAQIAIYSADQIEFVMNVSATIDKTEVLIGETAKVTAKISPAFMAETVTVTYESSNTEVATVDVNGVVKGIGEGDAVITVRAGEKSATVNVTVVATATQYTVSYSAGANGSITSVKAGEVDVASGSKVDADTVITVNVAPAEGYRLASYTIGEGEADTSVVGKTSFNLTITGDTVIVVSFEAVPVVAASITMPPANKTDCETNTYDNTQVLKNADGVEWTTENFSNNNWGWSSIRCGRKKDASVASIYTNAAIANAVKTVAITFDKAQNLNKVNSAKIIVATNKEFTEGVQEIDILSMIKVGEVKIAITTPTANCFYKIVFDCAAAGSNGSIGITSIQYIA